MTQKHHDTEKLRKDGTGRWFFEGDNFIAWEDNVGLLWIEGLCKPTFHMVIFNSKSFMQNSRRRKERTQVNLRNFLRISSLTKLQYW